MTNRSSQVVKKKPAAKRKSSQVVKKKPAAKKKSSQAVKKQPAAKRKSECAYCVKLADGRDHVPPKNLFPTPRPRLVSVPSCKQCNLGASKDDEYFRLMVLARADIGSHPAAPKLIDHAYGRLGEPRKSRFRNAILAGVQEGVEVRTRSGIYTGERVTTYQVQVNRLRRVASRIVAGLYFHEKGEKLPTGYRAYGLTDHDVKAFLNRGELHISQVLREDARIALSKGTYRAIGDVFSYHFHFDEADPYESRWVMRFYDYFVVLGRTLKASGAK